MKKRMGSIPAVLLFAVSLLVSGGQVPAGSLAGRVSALLLEFPAESAGERDVAASELIELGPAAVVDLCGRLAEPGTGDDSLVRFALDAMVVRAGRPGASAERMMVVEGILKSLETSRDTENAAFLIFLLQNAGRAEIVKPLARFLARPELTGPVVRALTATGLPEASSALSAALKKARGGSAVAIIRGLGDLRGRKAVPALLLLAEGSDPDVRSAALDALADIGDPVARPVLERVREPAQPSPTEGFQQIRHPDLPYTANVSLGSGSFSLPASPCPRTGAGSSAPRCCRRPAGGSP